jgi:hypothetical protein
VEPVGVGRRYPEASIITALNAQIHNPETRDLLSGKVLVNSYVTEEVEHLAGMAGARTLMDNSTFLKFVGKEYLHKIAADEGFDVPPGVVISQPDETAAKVSELWQTINRLGLDPDHTKVWIKPTSLSGGQGVFSRPGADENSVSTAFFSIAQAYKDCGFYEDNESPVNASRPFSGIRRFMPIVMEVDVSRIPGAVRKLDDVAINAIISDAGVTYVESTPFDAPDGEYVGSRLPQKEDEKLVHPAKVAADKLMNRMWREGYRGYLGVDAVMVEQTNGEIKAYLNDINARLCGATPLIGLSHKAEEKLGFRPHAYSTKMKLALPEGCTDAFSAVTERLDGYLYRGAETGYTGIVPTVVDVPPGSGKISVRIAVIGKDAAHLQKMRSFLGFGNGH